MTEQKSVVPAGASSQDPPLSIRQSFREIRKGIVVLWWAFFDWVAVVQWKALVVVAVLTMILGGGVLKLPTLTFFVVVSAFIIKIVAGGKRRAERTATEATKRAEEEQLQRTVLEARMEALQAQIEPHFLFNTLASIDQLIQTDPPRASKMQRSLIRYLRSAMPQMREGKRPTLGQQVDLSSAFLEIMAVRMEGRMESVVHVPDGLKSAVFPSMMLQTLVENAIKHGLAKRADAGRIEISARIVADRLELSVRDDGIGMTASEREGVGLSNTRERLHTLYGADARVTIQAPRDGGGGTEVVLTLPLRVIP